MRIAMIGTGYVGLVSGACLSDFGHDVVCIDKDARKIELLHKISELHEIGGDNADAAFGTFSRALRDDPRVTRVGARSTGSAPPARNPTAGREPTFTRSRATVSPSRRCWSI